MIRGFLAFGFVVLFLIFTIPVRGILYVIGKFNPSKKDVWSLRMVQWAFRNMCSLSKLQIDVVNHDKVPTDQPVLYVANHNSYFDIIMTYPLCPGLTGYVAKDVLGKVPLLNKWMKSLYCLFLKRDDIKASLKTILEAIEYVKKGISICIFPEGTRGKTDKMLPFKEGAMKISSKTGCPIVPIAISNSRDIFTMWHFIPVVKPAHVIIEYGDPIYPKELPKEQQKNLGKLSQEIIQEMLDRNSKLI